MKIICKDCKHKERFKKETIEHQNDMQLFSKLVCSSFIDRVKNHDFSKLEDDLVDKYVDMLYHGDNKRAYLEHAKRENHHLNKEGCFKGTEDLFDVIEMLMDGISASNLRTGILDPKITVIPSLDYKKIMRNTIVKLVDLYVKGGRVVDRKAKKEYEFKY